MINCEGMISFNLIFMKTGQEVFKKWEILNVITALFSIRLSLIFLSNDVIFDPDFIFRHAGLLFFSQNKSIVIRYSNKKKLGVSKIITMGLYVTYFRLY